jgi:hypothetical protein
VGIKDAPEVFHPFDVKINAKYSVDQSYEFAKAACTGIPADGCQENERASIYDVVKSFHSRGLFVEKPCLVSFVKHEIPTGNKQPYKAKPRLMTKAKRKVLDDIVNRFMEDDIIKPCESNWQSSPILVKKKSKPN